MITYNHEKFIEQAVRGVLMQETNFPYELVIGEDHSRDRTRDIVVRLREEFPDKIRLLLHENNIGMIPNLLATFDTCMGDYIAMCEGDDYWTDPHKLQIQVDYMDSHPTCSLCFHPVSSYDGDRKTFISEEGVCEEGTKYNLEFLIFGKQRYIIPTASVVFRRHLLNYPEQLKKSNNGDTVIHFLLAGLGSLDYINKNMAVHVIHSQGAHSGASPLTKFHNALDTKLLLNEYYNFAYSKQLNIKGQYALLALEYQKSGNHNQASYFLRESLSSKQGGKTDWFVVLKVFVLRLFPSIYRLYMRFRQLV